MQMAVVEFCRNVLNIKEANSKEFDKETSEDVITTMDDANYINLGASCRLGSFDTIITDENSLAFKIYGKKVTQERHRHRYEVNLKYRERLEEKGFIFSGIDKKAVDLNLDTRLDLCELKEHPFFFALQSHPEYKTYPFEPSPVFYSFVLAAAGMYDKFEEFSKTRKMLSKEFDYEE